MLTVSKAPPQEKRKHPRISVNIPAVYRSASLTVDLYVVNLSQSGAFLACPVLDVGGAVGEILLTLPGQLNPLVLHGRVVWTHHLPPRSGMGFIFTELERDHRLSLANFLIARYCNG